MMGPVANVTQSQGYLVVYGIAAHGINFYAFVYICNVAHLWLLWEPLCLHKF